MNQVIYTEFREKVVFVTGAASGIGAAQAAAFLEQGAHVFAFDRQLGSFSELEKGNSDRFRYFLGDVQNQGELVQAVEQCNQDFGPIDILLNTAGVLDGYLPLLETTEELFDYIFAINVKSCFQITKLVLPQMVAKKTGVIIPMSSIAGLVAGGGGMAYTMSKHALAGFIKQLALDYADQGIRVNGIAPGAINTPMNAADFAGDGEMAKKVAEETPVKRWAKPEEVASLTLFLASEQASYLHGAIIPIDGGWTIK